MNRRQSKFKTPNWDAGDFPLVPFMSPPWGKLAKACSKCHCKIIIPFHVFRMALDKEGNLFYRRMKSLSSPWQKRKKVMIKCSRCKARLFISVVPDISKLEIPGTREYLKIWGYTI